MNGSNSKSNTSALRGRLIDATVAETVECSRVRLEVERIIRRAGVDRASFELHFADADAAVEAAHQCLFERFHSRLVGTCELQPTWPLKVKVGIGLTLDLAAESPVEARFLSLDIGGGGLESRQVTNSRDRLARLLVAGRNETPRGAGLPGVIEQAFIAGIAGVILAQIQTGEARQLPSLAPQLVELILTPYLGREEATAVARRPPPRFEDG